MMKKLMHSELFFQFLIILVAALILLAPVYMTGKALFWGTPMMQFIPWWDFSYHSLLEGEIPLWNPHLGMGAPLVANYQSALFYPPHWLNFLLSWLGGIRLLAWGQSLLVALHLAWAGFGMLLLTRRLGLNAFSQLISALAFSLSGYLVSRAGFFSINASVSWMPWVIAWLTPELDKQIGIKKRLPVLAILITMQLLSGHAQIAYYSLILAAIWAAYWGWQGRFSLSEDHQQREYIHSKPRINLSHVNGIGAAWLYLGVAVLIALAISAVQLIPTAEYLYQSQRATQVDYDYVVNYSFWHWRLLTLIAPNMFGNPVTGDYWGYGNYWEDAIYIGLLPFLLAITAIIHAFRLSMGNSKLIQAPKKNSVLDPRFTFFLSILFLLALLIGLGKNTPVFPWLYRNIPTFDMFQAPTRIMIWAVFSLTILAGIGCERWLTPQGKTLYWTRLGTMAAFAIMLGSGLAWIFMGDISPSFIRSLALAGFLGFVGGLLSLVNPNHLDQSRDQQEYSLSKWHWVVTIFICIDLLIANWGLNPGIDAEIFQPTTYAKEIRKSLDGKRLFIQTQDEEIIKYERFLRFDTFSPGEDWIVLRNSLLPNVNMIDKIASANNYDPLVPARFAQWMEFINRLEDQEMIPYLQMMGVGIKQSVVPNSQENIHFKIIEGGERVHWFPCVMFVNDINEVWERLSANSLDLENKVIVEKSSETDSEQCISSEKGQVILIKESQKELVINVNAPIEGWLLLSDIWYPGWKVRLDDQLVEMYPANGLFRAVKVPSGNHEVIFIYQPLSFRVGLWITVFSIFAFVILFLFSFRKNE
jgi:hypothetical protein